MMQVEWKGVWKSGNLDQYSFILETIQDMAIVTMNIFIHHQVTMDDK